MKGARVSVPTRLLGRSGIEVSAIGFGAWAIGGPFWEAGEPRGWGEVDDDVSISAIHRALDLGVTFIDTADVYGTGHSERVIARALAGRRDQVVIASKFGLTFDEATRNMTGIDAAPGYIRRACQASLTRLGTEYIDLYQLHLGDLPYEQVDDVLATLEGLVDEGLIRAYGWSTDDAERATAFAKGPHYTAVQHQINVLDDAPAMLATCDSLDLASINRGPLAMGLLSGKYDQNARMGAADVRAGSPEWLIYFRDGRPSPEFLARLDAVRDILTSDGRTLAQGALAWLLARSSRTIPIPGIRTPEQATENAGVLSAAPLTPAQLAEIDTLLGRVADGVNA